MIAGLPWTAWVLLLAVIGVGPILVIIFFFKHRFPKGPKSPPGQKYS